MASYEQTGLKTCPKCKSETKNKYCPTCKCATKGSGFWSVRFRISNEYGENIQKRLSDWPEGSKNYFITKKDAEKAFYEYEKLYVRPTIKPYDHKLTFQEVFEKYKAYQIHEIKESSYITFINRIQNHILPYFKDKIAEDITTEDVSNWKIMLNNMKTSTGKSYAHGYKSSIFEAFKHMMNYAYRILGFKENIIIRVGGFKREKLVKNKMLFWEPEEFNRFYYAAKKDNSTDANMYRLLFLIYYFSGCRKNELTAINWNDILFNEEAISFSKTLTRKTLNNEYKITTPKTENSHRKTLLPSSIISQLKEYKTVCMQSEYFSETDFVFGGKQNLPEQSIRNWFDRWTIAAGVKRIRVHDLRHSHVSYLIHVSGHDLSMLYVIADRIGDTPEQVLKTYGHMFQSRQREVVTSINEHLNDFEF